MKALIIPSHDVRTAVFCLSNMLEAREALVAAQYALYIARGRQQVGCAEYGEVSMALEKRVRAAERVHGAQKLASASAWRVSPEFTP